MSSPVLRAAENTPFLAATRIRGLGNPSSVAVLALVLLGCALVAVVWQQPLVALSLLIAMVALFFVWFA